MLRAWLLAIAIVCIAFALLAARPVATPGPFLRDFEAYWSAGAIANAHADPYGRDIWSAERTIAGVDGSRDEVLPFVGPPSTLPLWRLLARLPYDAAARIWWTILACALVALVAIVLRNARGKLSAPLLFAALLLAIAFGPATSDLALGQIALVALLGASLVATPNARGGSWFDGLTMTRDLGDGEVPCHGEGPCPGEDRCPGEGPCPGEDRCHGEGPCPGEDRCPGEGPCPGEDRCHGEGPCPGEDRCHGEGPCPGEDRCHGEGPCHLDGHGGDEVPCHPELVEGRPANVAASVAAFFAFFQPNVALGLVSQIGRNRATIAMVLAAIVTYLIGVFSAGWNWPVNYAGLLAAHAGAERFSAIQITPAAVAFGAGATPAVAGIVGIVAAIAAVVAAVVLWRRIADPFARFAGFAALVPFVATFFHEHDLIVALIAALWCAVRTQGAARIVALAGTLLVAVDWLGLAQRPTGIAQSALLAAAAIFAFTALGERFDARLTLAATAPLAALFGAAALMGARHPAPVWPDALGNFHAPDGAAIAGIWFLEQTHSGLLAAAPAWSFLRALSLLGCAALALAIYLHSSYCRTASTHSDGSS